MNPSFGPKLVLLGPTEATSIKIESQIASSWTDIRALALHHRLLQFLQPLHEQLTCSGVLSPLL